MILHYTLLTQYLLSLQLCLIPETRTQSITCVSFRLFTANSHDLLDPKIHSLLIESLSPLNSTWQTEIVNSEIRVNQRVASRTFWFWQTWKGMYLSDRLQ
jgi:hypothetical protein